MARWQTCVLLNYFRGKNKPAIKEWDLFKFPGEDEEAKNRDKEKWKRAQAIWDKWDEHDRKKALEQNQNA